MAQPQIGGHFQGRGGAGEDKSADGAEEDDQHWHGGVLSHQQRFQHIVRKPDGQQRDRPKKRRQQLIYREKVNDDGQDHNARRQLDNG